MAKAAASPPETTVAAANARFFRVLGDPTRLAIVSLLLERPHTVSELVEALDLAQSKVSNHLACLRWCRCIQADRKGRTVVCSIADDRLRPLLELATKMTHQHVDHLSTTNKIGPAWI